MELTAERFISELELLQSDEEIPKSQRYFKTGPGEYGEGDQFMGVRKGGAAALVKTFSDMEPAEIEKLLESPIHEVRAAACSIMEKQARRKTTPASRRQELFDLYLRRHDRINNWDLVDVAAPFVIGRQLLDGPRDLLYTLAGSSNVWERRTAITATAYFLRQGESDETFRIAELLVNDPEEIINKCTGGWLRTAGDIDRPKLIAFLDRHAATMPRVTLRYALEHFEKSERDAYLARSAESGSHSRTRRARATQE